jgi:hypothetical protein
LVCVFYFIGNYGDDVDGSLKETLASRHSGDVWNRQAIKMLERVKLMV